MEIILRSTAIFFFIWLLTRAIGKRELAEMTALELILLVTVGDLVQQGATQEDMSMTGAMMAVGTIGFWVLVFSYVTFKWKPTHRIIAGFPVIVIRDGDLQDEVLHLERINSSEVFEAARDQGISDIQNVKIAVLEPDGRFSFITGERHDQPPKHAS